MHGSSFKTGKMYTDIRTTWEKDAAPINRHNVREDAILGFDFMEEHQVGWDWTRKTLNVDREHLPCKMGWLTTKVCRIITKAQRVIPPHSELVIAGIIIDKTKNATTGVIEGQQKFLQQFPIAVAAVIAHKEGKSVPIRIINANTEPIVIPERD